PVLAAALKQPRIADLDEIREHADPIGWLEKNLKTDTLLAPEIVRLSLNGDHAEDLALILNAITRAYLDEVIGREREKQRVNLEILLANYRTQTKLLHDKRKALRELEADLQVDDEETARQKRIATATQLNVIEGKHLEKQFELRQAEQELAALAERQGKTEVRASGKEIQDRLLRDPAYQKLQEGLSRTEEQIAEYKQNVNPAMRGAMLEGPLGRKDALQKEIKRREEEVQSRLQQELEAQAKDDGELQAAKARDHIAALKEQVKAYSDELKRKREELRRLGMTQSGDNSADLEALRGDVAQLESLVKKMADRIDLLNVEPLP